LKKLGITQKAHQKRRAREKTSEQNFRIERLFPNDGLVEPDFHAMSQKYYATRKNGSVEPFSAKIAEFSIVEFESPIHKGLHTWYVGLAPGGLSARWLD
jgi:hypothetical protein